MTDAPFIPEFNRGSESMIRAMKCVVAGVRGSILAGADPIVRLDAMDAWLDDCMKSSQLTHPVITPVPDSGKSLPLGV